MTLTVRSVLSWSCAVLAALLGGCVNCNSIACNGGFALTAAMSDGGDLPDGLYDVHLAIEGDAVDFSCAIAGGLPPSGGCAPAEAGRWSIVLYVPEGVSGITIRVSDEDAGGGEYSVRGPASVSVTIALDGTTVGEGGYSPTYTRDEEFYGDEQCGYCDSLVHETMALARP